MKIYSPWSVVCVLTVAVLIVLPSAVKANGGVCDQKKWNRSLGDIIRTSEFVGVYGFIRSEPNESLVTEEERIGYSYYLIKQSGLYGDAPLSLEIDGLEPLSYPPSHYIVSIQNHSHLTEDNIEKHQFSPLMYLKSEDRCKFLPGMLKGYDYLIFGGVETPANYAVIISTELDPLIKLVKSAINSVSADTAAAKP